MVETRQENAVLNREASKRGQDAKKNEKMEEQMMRMVIGDHHGKAFARGVELRSAREVARFVLEQRE